jgi:hypothetical protein
MRFLFDGFVSVLGGMNAGTQALLLPDVQYAFGLNVSSRGGMVRTRPIFRKVATLGTGHFQGAATYSMNDSDRIVYGIDGSVGSFNVTTEVNWPGLATLFDTPLLYFAQADRYLIVQDNSNRPAILYQDTLLRYAKAYAPYNPADPATKNEVFTGSVTKYGHGRVFTVAKHVHNNDGQPNIATEGRPYFVAGDIIKASDPEEVLKFSETTYLNSGGAAGMPSEFGFIQGMGFFRNVNSGTGLGPLIVFAKKGVGAFAVNTPREGFGDQVPGWADKDFSQVLFEGVGTLSHRAVLSVNDDLMFRGLDGIRSIRYTTSEIAGGSGALSSTPLSNEVRTVLALDDAADLPYVSSAFVENRVFFTSSGRTGDAFRSIISLDTAITHGITSPTARPIYDGIWTGLNFLQIVTAQFQDRPTLFAITQNGDDIELWRLDEQSGAHLDNNTAQPLCRVYTRNYNFGQAQNLKEFSYVDIWVRELKGDANLTAYFRPEGYGLWNACSATTLLSDITSSGALPQRRYRVRLTPLTNHIVDPSTGLNVLHSLSFQFCIQWEGNLTLERVVFGAVNMGEEPYVCCDPETTQVALVEGPGGVVLDDYSYSMV